MNEAFNLVIATLALLTAGLVLGCVNAWQWVAREDRAMDHSGDLPRDRPRDVPGNE